MSELLSASSSPESSAVSPSGASSKKVEVAPMSLAAYSSSFVIFAERSSEYPAMQKLFDRMLAERYMAAARANNGSSNLMSGPANARRGVRFLSVGGGDGSFDYEMLLRMKHAGIALESYTCVEPSDDRFPQLAMRFGATAEQVNKLDTTNAVVCFSAALGCPVRLVKESFDERTQINSKAVKDSPRNDGGFDLVLMSHCFYWFLNPTAVALHALSLVSQEPSDECPNGGNVLIFHQSASEGVCGFYNHFASTRLHWTKRPLADHGLSAQILHAALTEEKVNVDLYEESSAVDFTDAVVGGDGHVLSELLSFFIQTPFQDLPVDMQREMEDYVHTKLRWRNDSKINSSQAQSHGHITTESKTQHRVCEFPHDSMCLLLRQTPRKA